MSAVTLSESDICREYPGVGVIFRKDGKYYWSLESESEIHGPERGKAGDVEVIMERKWASKMKRDGGISHVSWTEEEKRRERFERRDRLLQRRWLVDPWGNTL